MVEILTSQLFLCSPSNVNQVQGEPGIREDSIPPLMHLSLWEMPSRAPISPLPPYPRLFVCPSSVKLISPWFIWVEKWERTKTLPKMRTHTRMLKEAFVILIAWNPGAFWKILNPMLHVERRVGFQEMLNRESWGASCQCGTEQRWFLFNFRLFMGCV